MLALYTLKSIFNKGLIRIVKKGPNFFIIVDFKYLNSFIKFLRYSLKFSFAQLLDIWVVDYPNRDYRFEVNYLFLSINSLSRLYVKTWIQEYGFLYSVSTLFASGNWLEREIWDMYGIFFVNHSDLRRILTDYGFVGFPLRKDFPLTGYVELRYDDADKRVVVESLETAQEFRFFNFITPWETK